jgi:hypothetical protein
MSLRLDVVAGTRSRPYAGLIRLAVLCPLFSVLCGAAAAPSAAPLDLGQGLSYIRLRHGPDDTALLKAAWPAPALVVDLRYPKGDPIRVFTIDLPARPPTGRS